MGKGIFKSLLFSILCIFCAFSARAAVSLFSDYGQIQNVQFYSSNPFWSPNSSYNQRLPQPVYAQGADLTAGDCFNVVQPLVAAQCAARDNCKNTVLSDIRPTIMVQLSTLPGHNYVSACNGYIDGVFESYLKQSGNNELKRPVAFPKGTIQNPDFKDDGGGGTKIQNPYKQQIPKWQQEIKERTEELQALQRENGADNYIVSAADFPKTAADIPLGQYIENAREGYMPFKDLNPYRTLDVKTKKEWCAEHSDLDFCHEDLPAQFKPRHNKE